MKKENGLFVEAPLERHTHIPQPAGHIIRQALEMAFAEDWGFSGDLTSQVCIDPQLQIKAQLRLRGGRVAPQDDNYALCGLELAKAALQYDAPAVQVKLLQVDGDVVPAGTLLAEISGPAALLLGRERVTLNYLSHLSGIASMTRRYVRAVAHTQARIVDTRKTTPGLRTLEKFAVRCGGGHNHRFGLFDAVMIKDNHIVAAGGITAALRAAKANSGHMVRIELEVDSLQQLFEVDFDEPALRPDCVLLDNMSPKDMREAVAYVNGRAFCEASGRIELSQLASIAESGVNLISVGALTHSAPIIDIGLDFNSRVGQSNGCDT